MGLLKGIFNYLAKIANEKEKANQNQIFLMTLWNNYLNVATSLFYVLQNTDRPFLESINDVSELFCDYSSNCFIYTFKTTRLLKDDELVSFQNSLIRKLADLWHWEYAEFKKKLNLKVAGNQIVINAK